MSLWLRQLGYEDPNSISTPAPSAPITLRHETAERPFSSPQLPGQSSLQNLLGGGHGEHRPSQQQRARVRVAVERRPGWVGVA